MSKAGVGVAITVFPRRGENTFLVATIDIKRFYLAKVAKLLGIEDEYDFFGGEWEIQTEAQALYFEEDYGVKFCLDTFQYFLGYYNNGTQRVEVTRDNFMSVLGPFQ